MNKGRSSIYVLAGGYLIYRAYSLFKELPGVESSDITLVWISIVCFAIFGAVFLVIGLKNYMKITKEEKEVSNKEKNNNSVSEIEDNKTENEK